jgi:hypothetical protein
MQSSSECRRLMETMADEPVMARWELVKCAAGVAILVLLLVLVVSDERVMTGSLAQREAPPRAATAEMSAEEHRRHVFDERHQRFHGDGGQRRVVSEMAE